MAKFWLISYVPFAALLVSVIFMTIPSCTTSPVPYHPSMDNYRSFSLRQWSNLIPFLTIRRNEPSPTKLVTLPSSDQLQTSPGDHQKSDTVNFTNSSSDDVNETVPDVGLKDFNDEFEKNKREPGNDYGHMRFGRDYGHMRFGRDYGHMRFG